MVQSQSARNIQLSDLRDQFGLRRTEDAAFFTEWASGLPKLSSAEYDRLSQVRTHYLYLLEYQVLESIVKMVVLSPVLEIAGFYSPPFRVTGEVGVQVSASDDNRLIRGNIDVLVVQQRLWVSVIEAKNSAFSLTAALPQTLSYLMAGAQSQAPLFGAITNGTEFIFIKLVGGSNPVYGLSNTFSLLNLGHDLQQVTQIFRRFGQLIAN
ncbi:MAG: restriction endonuclease subunit R [Cyanobacteria bacterium P01_D01_bin.1]